MTARARNTDPSTSKVAAASLTNTELNKLHEVILGHLKKAGRKGLTAVEIADLSGIPRDSLSPRMKTLIKKKLIVDLKDYKTKDVMKRVPHGYTRSSKVVALACYKN